jgi:hypothetical protein
MFENTHKFAYYQPRNQQLQFALEGGIWEA